MLTIYVVHTQKEGQTDRYRKADRQGMRDPFKFYKKKNIRNYPYNKVKGFLPIYFVVAYLQTIAVPIVLKFLGELCLGMRWFQNEKTTKYFKAEKTTKTFKARVAFKDMYKMNYEDLCA